MAIDISLGGFSLQADSTGLSVSIDDLAGLGIDIDFSISRDEEDGGIDPPFGEPDGELESLLGEFTPGEPVFAAEADATEPGAADADSFDSETISSLTLLGGADDTADDIDPLTGA